jgi:hypothetical protein
MDVELSKSWCCQSLLDSGWDWESRIVRADLGQDSRLGRGTALAEPRCCSVRQNSPSEVNTRTRAPGSGLSGF